MIVDTHVHVISDDLETYPLVTSDQRLGWVDEARFTVEEFVSLMGEAGVGAATLVQPLTAYAYDNRYCALAAKRYSDRLTGVAIVNMEQSDAAPILRDLVEQDGMKGVRLFARHRPGANWLDEPDTFPVWELARELRFPITVIMRVDQASKLGHMLERFPEVMVALDHLGSPPLADGPPYDSAAPIMDLARFPNLRLKYSPSNMQATAKGSGDFQDVLKRFVDRFGVDRMMWGSNFSATYRPAYPELVDMGHEWISFLSSAEQAKLMGGNALELWPSLRSAGS